MARSTERTLALRASSREAAPRARAWFARSVRGGLVVFGSAPLWVALLERTPLHAASDVMSAWFALQCHRESARSLAVAGAVLPVCVRCLGIYLGLCAGALVLQPKLRPAMARLWVALAALVMVLDVLTESLQMRPEWAALRMVTGFLLAYPASVSLVLAARGAAQPERRNA